MVINKLNYNQGFSAGLSVGVAEDVAFEQEIGFEPIDEIDDIYKRISKAETGGEKTPWIRTKAKSSEGSSAFGEVQITKGLIDGVLKDPISYNLDDEDIETLEWLRGQQELMLKYGGKDMKPGYERYDYGESGDFTDDMIPKYRKAVKKVMRGLYNRHIESGGTKDDFWKVWRFGEPKSKSPNAVDERYMKDYLSFLKDINPFAVDEAFADEIPLDQIDAELGFEPIDTSDIPSPVSPLKQEDLFAQEIGFEPIVSKEEADLLGTIGRGLSAGFGGIVEAGGGLIDLSLPGTEAKVAGAATEIIGKKIKEKFKPIPSDSPLVYDIAAAFGSSVPMMAPGIGLAGSLIKGGMAAQKAANVATIFSTVLESGLEAGGVGVELKDRGEKRSEVQKRALMTFSANMPLLFVSNKLSGLFDLKKGQNLILKVGQTALFEGGQEAGQEAIANIATDKPITENIAKAGMLGGIVGGSVSGIVGLATNNLDKQNKEAVLEAFKEDVNNGVIGLYDENGQPVDISGKEEQVFNKLLLDTKKVAIEEITGEPVTEEEYFQLKYNKKDIDNLIEWESNMPKGERISYVDDEGKRQWIGVPSAHSKVMQEIGIKKSFDILEKARSGKELTLKEEENLNLLLEDYRTRLKAGIEQQERTAEDVGREITDERREELRQAVEETKEDEEGIEYDWDGNVIEKKPESKITEAGNIRIDLQAPEKKELFQEKGELFEGVQEEGAGYKTKTPVFYSKLEKVIDEKMPKFASKDMVKGILSSSGVKQEEIDWMDVEGFLEGKEKVSKQELLDYLKENQVEIKEVEKGGTETPSDPDEYDQLIMQRDNLANEILERGETIETTTPELRDQYNALDRALRQRTPEDTVFSKFQTPGGENYRELLLTLPSYELNKLRSQMTADKLDDGTYQVSIGDRFIGNPIFAISQEDAINRVPLDAISQKTKDLLGIKREFTSTHFSEPNILVHVRMNDRVDLEGNKVLFLEEVQSDWHQKGRKEGYITPVQTITEEQLNKDGFYLLRTDDARGYTVVNSEGQQAFGSYRNTKEETLKAWSEIRAKDIGLNPKFGVPNAPFKKSWHELAMKRMLRYAAENGYDKLAWTTGEQQAERYDLSKHIDSIEYEFQGGGKEEKYWSIKALNKDGNVILSQNNIEQSKLSEFIGKEATDKIIKSNEFKGTLVNQDLKIGGEGMKGFYDVMLPAFMNKYAKKWGAKVGEIRVKTEDSGIGAPNSKAREETSSISVHSVDITPVMKESVMGEGQQLFTKNEKYSNLKNESEAAYGNEAKKKLALRNAEGRIERTKPADRQRSGVSRFAKDFKKDGRIDTVGQEVKNSQDAAELASLFRSPFVENFQVIYIKEGKVAAHQVISSGEASWVDLKISKTNASIMRYVESVKSAARRLGADSVYLAHNHPSGKPEPSNADINVTSFIGSKLENAGIDLSGHIVTDGDSYALINSDTLRSGKMYEYGRYKEAKEDFAKKPISGGITTVDTAVEVAMGFKRKDKEFILFLDNYNKVVHVDYIGVGKNISKYTNEMLDAYKAPKAIIVLSQDRVLTGYQRKLSSSGGVVKGVVDIIVLKDNGEYISKLEDRELTSSKAFTETSKPITRVQEETKEYASPAFKYYSERSPQDFSQFVEQLNRFASGQAILRKAANLRVAAGYFYPIPKKGEVKISQESLQDDAVYMSVLAHELGHALEYNVVGKNNHPRLVLFGDKINNETLAKLYKELRAVTEDIAPGGLAGKLQVGDKYGSAYYNRPTELIARFFQKMLVSPGNLEEMAPTALELLNKQAVKYPIIQEFLEAVNKSIDKGQIKTSMLRDFRQLHHKYLGKRAGNRAYGDLMVWRAMKERGKIAIEGLIKEKFKNVKDSPETLFKAVESIKVTKGGTPEFGTRDFAVAKTEEEGDALFLLGYDKTPEPVLIDGIAYDQYAKQRYSPEEAERIFNSLSLEGKALVKDFTSARDEAKDFFNREVIKDVYKVEGNIEGWVYHYFEDKPGSPIFGGEKFKNRKAGTRKTRAGASGYVEDFQKAMTKVLVDLEGERHFNDFIKRYFARVTRPLAEGATPAPGWIEVTGTLQTGVGLPQEKNMVIIDKASGKKIPVKSTRYQMPREIYERFKLWRGLVDEASGMVRLVNDLNRYWRINILAHPGSATTNFNGGALQYSAKILTDFYKEVLTGQIDMPQTKRNISSMIKVLLPKGWMKAPDWVYGSDLSNFYGQFMKQESPVSKAIDEYGNKALKLFSLYERYWKKVIMLSENVSDLDSLNKITTEGLALPTEEERELIRQINEKVDLYAYDYDNVPAWLEAHQKSWRGQLIKPFAKYPYKYAKQVLTMVENVFDGTLKWQERLATLLTLSTIVAAYAMFSYDRRKKQETPIASLDIEIPARLQTRGRLFIKQDGEGNEIFVRVAKYPFINLTQAGMEFVDGNWEGAKDLTSDMLGSLGPLASVGLLAFNYRNKYNTYDSVPVILGESLATFTPGYRVLDDVSRMLDPFQRKQEDFWQTFTKVIPTTDEALQEKLHGKIRTERVPVEGEISGAEGQRTTVDYALKNYSQDVLLSLLSGVYVNRIDPKIAEAYIIRKTKNLEKRKQKEETANEE